MNRANMSMHQLSTISHLFLKTHKPLVTKGLVDFLVTVDVADLKC